MPEQVVQVFQGGMVDGLDIDHAQFGQPRLLENCHVERGAIRTRRGHTTKETDTDADSIRAVHYWPAIYYTCRLNGSIGEFGRFVGGAFSRLNEYTTGTATVSGTTVTLSGADPMTKRINANNTYFEVEIGGSYTTAVKVSSITNDTVFKVASGPGDVVGANYKLIIGGNNITTEQGMIARCATNYLCFVKYGSPVLYNTTLGKSWYAGIPAPDVPARSATTGGSMSLGWYSYKITFRMADGYEGEASAVGSVEITGSNNAVDLTLPSSLDYATTFNIYRTTVASTQAEAEAATHYLLITNQAVGAYADTLTDDGLTFTTVVPAETTAFSATSTNFYGVRYIDGFLWVWGATNKVYRSGRNDEASGLDEPNYWQLDYDAGLPDEYVYNVLEYRNRTYALKPNGIYVLDKLTTNADYWYFAPVIEGVGCGYINMACAGMNGIYTVHNGRDGRDRVFRVSASGQVVDIGSMIQGTLDSVSSFYCMDTAAGRIVISTDLGRLVYDEDTNGWWLGTGKIIRSLSVTNGTFYAGGDAGKVYTLYTNSTDCDTGAYTWKCRTGPADGDSRFHPKNFPAVTGKFLKDNAGTHAVTVKISVDNFTNYIQDDGTRSGASDWSATSTIPASTDSYAERHAVPHGDEDRYLQIEFSGPGGYGHVALTGYSADHTEPAYGTVDG